MHPDIRPRATKEIGSTIATIKSPIEQGYAYAADNGDVYFAVRSDENYGEVSGRRIDDLMVGARIEENEDKRDPLDFALWGRPQPGRAQLAVSVGRRAVPAGTPNARPWCIVIWARRSTFTAAAAIWRFRIMRTSARRPRAAGMCRSSTPGCIRACCASTARRWSKSLGNFYTLKVSARRAFCAGAAPAYAADAPSSLAARFLLRAP